MTLGRNARAGEPDIVQDFFDGRIHVPRRAGKETIADPILENASVGDSRNSQPRYLVQSL